MKIAASRACAWVSFALLTYAPLAAAQTIERIAGGRIIDDMPALEGPIKPISVSVGPDGSIYAIDLYTNRVVRRDPATARLFAVPAGQTYPFPANWNSVKHLFFGLNGAAYQLSNNVLYRLDTATNALTPLTSGFGVYPSVACRNVPENHSFVAAGDGTVYFTDGFFNSICKIVNGVPQRIAGTGTEVTGFAGDGGNALFAKLNNPQGIAIDAANNLYISDSGNHRIRKITASTGLISTITGTGQTGKAGENVPALGNAISNPTRLALGGSNNLYVIEAGNFRVRRLNLSTALISTAAGNGLQASGPPGEGVPATQVAFVLVQGIAVHPNGDLVIAEYGAHRVLQVSQTTGLINTVAGNGAPLFCGETSAPLDACLFEPQGVAVDANNDVYIADTGNRRIRKLSAESGLLTTYAGRSGPENQYLGDGGPAIDVNFPWGVKGLAFDGAGNLYAAGGSGNRIYRIDKITGLISAIAGSGEWGFSGDGGPALAAKTQGIDSVAVDSAGNVFFTDTFNYRVRKVAAGTGIITTVAGNGLTSGPLGDGGPATAASLDWPRSVKFDQNGNLLVMDYQHRRIRKIDKSTGIITTIAGNGTSGYDGDGRLATLAAINDLAFTTDAAGNIFLIGSTMRWIEASTGIIRTIPGATQPTAEGFFITPWELAADNAGHLYDATGQVILKISGLPVSLPDNTPPQIQPNVAGTLGSDGWYTSNVQITWTVTDPENAVTKTGCDATSITQDTANVVFTCTATSAGGTSSSSITLKRDATPPTVSVGAVSPAPNAHGWNNSDVSIPYTLSDNLSGLVPVNLPNPITYTNEGVSTTAATTVSDVAGNTATLDFPAVRIDKTPPLVSPDVSGTPGSNDWYLGNLQVGWSVNEIPESIESMTGCDTIAVTTDTAGVTYTCAVTSAGGTTSSSTTVKLDGTAPTLVFGAATPAANAFGWHNFDVEIPFTVNDVLSGVASTSPASPLLLTNEGVGVQRTVAVTDAAGNTATFASVPVNIDKTNPLIAPIVTGTLGNNDWYRSDVTVTWSINEMPASVRDIIGCEGGTVTADTGPDGVHFGCLVNSGGGSMSVPVWIKRDVTPPTVQWGTFSPAPNANGWNKTNVSVPFTPSDVSSGVVGISQNNPLVISEEGAGVVGQLMLTDRAGNVAMLTTPPRNIDKTVPYAEMETPIDGATYGFYADVVADFVCEDISLLSCTAPVANGAMVNTTVAGARSFKVTAKDKVGFTTNHTHNFNVASTFNFGGFVAPMRASPTLNLVTRGSLVPVRWRLPDGHGGFVSNPASFVSATVATFTCSGSVVALNDTAAGAAGLSFNAATGTFTYNWATDAGWTGCRKLTIKLKDNSTRELRFKFQ